MPPQKAPFLPSMEAPDEAQYRLTQARRMDRLAVRASQADAARQDDPVPFTSQTGFAWCWVYLAHLSVQTPSGVLKKHGVRLYPPETETAQNDCDPSEPTDSHAVNESVHSAVAAHPLFMGSPTMESWESEYADWVPVEIPSIEAEAIRPDDPLREDRQWGPENSDQVTMDLPGQLVRPMRYRDFLLTLRTILESSQTPSEKREAVATWINTDFWGDVLQAWDSQEAFLDELFPSFLGLLRQRGGISGKAVESLQTHGIVNRVILSRALDGVGPDGMEGFDLEGLPGVGPQTIHALESFRVSLKSIQDPGLRAILRDPLVQMIY